ncbi:hypothetical protein [Streptomyces poonensis]|uniref:Uncharacterized protein n=1 Tax=Streptomyces poonensis TaxID=68255 RepID=A0A918UJ19_9ACTN|nr:hypothetical protein [Streptomyces poonensis]GGZ15506.1 hypothetical protein GCM10010365_39100 [Streptomyces poonensis]GLJ91513.1 hypothetical protein GCM10017589_41200 [Streptomyces poonensis]
MRLWLTTRRIPVLAAALVAYATLTAAAGDTLVDLPSLGSDTARPLVLFAPLLTCIGLAFSLSSRLPAAEASGSRPVPRFDQALILITAFAAVAVAYAVTVLLDTPTANTAGRNTAFLVGLMLCARRIAGHQAAAITPVAWVITMMLIGNSGGNGQAQPWSVILMPPDHLSAALTATATLALGTVAAPAAPIIRDAS